MSADPKMCDQMAEVFHLEDTRPGCAVGGRFTLRQLPATKGPAGTPLPERCPWDPSRQKPVFDGTARAHGSVIKLVQNHDAENPLMSLLVVHARYRPPFTPVMAEESNDGNRWNFDPDARCVLISARLNRAAAWVHVAIPVARRRTLKRRILSPWGDGDSSFAIEPHEDDRLSRARVILLDAPPHVATMLRELE